MAQQASPRFPSRAAAGQELAEVLRHLELDAPIILALPSGGVPVAAEVAMALEAPLDLLIAHEITAHREDLGVGVVGVATADIREATAHAMGMSDDEIDDKVGTTQRELDEIMQRVSAEREPLSLIGRTAVVVDDALATAQAAAASAYAVRARGATEAVLAAPVAVATFADALKGSYDEVVALERVGDHLDRDQWYGALPPVTPDDIVAAVLRSPSIEVASP